MAQLFDPSFFSASKPMPLILILDTSDSMNIIANPCESSRAGVDDITNGETVKGGITWISALNDAIRNLLQTLSKYEDEHDFKYLVSILTFGDDTRLLFPPSYAADVRFTDLRASGSAPLGKVLEIAKNLIEDRDQTPGRAYRPLVVLISAGSPNAGWEVAFENFIHNGRSAKCDRMALAIGKEADRNMLEKFVDGTGHAVVEVDSAEEITIKLLGFGSNCRCFHPNMTITMGSVWRPDHPDGIRGPNIIIEGEEGGFW